MSAEDSQPAWYSAICFLALQDIWSCILVPAHSPGVRLCAVEAAHRSIFDQVDLPNYPTLACHLSDACHTRSARGQMKSALAWQPAGAPLALQGNCSLTEV